MRPMPWAIIGEARSLPELQTAIDATVAANVSQMASGDIPPLYESGVVYERETRQAPPVGMERFQTARDAYLLGHADCDGLAPWRAAELRYHAGERARAEVVPSPSGYHVRVKRENGTIEDPSALLGMLDGYGIEGTDARPSARARRRRLMAGLARKGERLLKKAASSSGAPQRMYLEQAKAVGRMLAGHERQAAADGEPPLSEAEIHPELAAERSDGSVGEGWASGPFGWTGVSPWAPALLILLGIGRFLR